MNKNQLRKTKLFREGKKTGLIFLDYWNGFISQATVLEAIEEQLLAKKITEAEYDQYQATILNDELNKGIPYHVAN